MNRARPMAARLKKKKPRVNHELRSTYGHAVKNINILCHLHTTNSRTASKLKTHLVHN